MTLDDMELDHSLVEVCKLLPCMPWEFAADTLEVSAGFIIIGNYDHHNCHTENDFLCGVDNL